MEERRLVEKILQGEKKAIDEFISKYRTSLLTFVNQRIDNPRDAEDIVQEALLSALDGLPNFKFRSSLFSWLCVISRHEIADFYRKRKIKTVLFSRFPFLEDWTDQALGPEGKYLRKELQAEIKKAAKQLSEGYWQILRLKYVEGLSMKKIARKLETTVKAVESRLSRARKKFREIWQRRI